MERLTKWAKNGCAYLVGVKDDEQEVVCESKNTLQCMLDAFKQLAAYEDTEHTPEECAAAFKELAIYRAAEQDGTLLRPQCKKGDHVRATVIRPYNGHELTIFGDVVDVQVVFRVSHSVCRYTDFLNSDFGKTVFFAPEAAEAALKEQEGQK